jgi:Lrp/AsnC family transcriptional regulator, regulator for asnA, asnC and gidA
MNSDDIDKLDRKILTVLQQDARTPFQEMSRELNVSGGTVHVRYNKLKDHGVIKGSKLLIDYGKLGYDVTAFIGVNLHNAGDYRAVLEKLKNMPEITEAHYTTGTYSIFIKVVAKSTTGLHTFLTEKLQTLKEIQSTETFISLDIPVQRDVSLM